tara:strand:- start:797 stop:5014 length:4218 start_codon:yes stop_codon:yes gene_type:complete
MAHESHFDYTGDVSKISKVTFGIMSPELFRSQSVVEVVHHDTFCGNDPVTGGLFDPRMGVLEFGQICNTDMQTNKETPGYFGHIELAVPVFHVQYFSVVQKIVRCVCYRCGELLHNSNHNHIYQKSKMGWCVEQSKKVKVCGVCAATQPDKYVKTDLCKMHALWLGGVQDGVEVEESKLDMTPKYVLNLFKQLKDSTIKSLGLDPKLSHPKWMIMEVFPVCPPSCRPSVHQDNGQRMEDDITIKYCDIVKYNNMIKSKLSKEPGARILDDWYNILQYHCSTLIDNEIAGVNPAAQRSGRPLKGLRQRLKGKEGRIRGNLMGKRVNFSSRTVITPDPVIDLEELGVPKRIATQLTFPEKVNKHNITKLKKCIKNGCQIYPGARAVFKHKNKKTISLNHIDRIQFAKMLEIGDTVIRHIQNGDWVIFNRQPSLHKMSMMAHRIRILDGLTFRLNISATTPYNADFDGDEMNMHVPQSLCSANEIACLASVNKQIVSPALNMPIITFVQDAVLGGHLMTMPIAKEFTHREMMNTYSWIKTNKPLDKRDNFTGFDALSYCIPNINTKVRNRSGKNVKITNGNIDANSGIFDKKVFTSLIHGVFRDCGAEQCGAFFNNSQHVIRAFLLQNSFTVGIRDLVLEDALKDQINVGINQQKLEVEKIVQTVHLNMFENLSSENDKTAFENEVTRLLTAARSGAENLLKKKHETILTNRFMNMVNGGSKGKLINLAQMTACLGQQIIEGRRVPYGFSGRTLPHYTKFDDSAGARGFVHGSFQKGMNPLEFFFHAMAGREGIIDTAVKTSSTGYIQRKLMKALEDYKVSWCKCVKDAQNNIIQYLYGDDNIDGISMENLSVPLIRCTDYLDEYSYPNDSGVNCHDNELLIHLSENMKIMFEWYSNNICDKNPESSIKFPVHIERVLLGVIESNISSGELTIKDIFDSYDKLFNRLTLQKYNDGLWMFRFMMYQHAHPKKLLNMGMNKTQFQMFVETIEVLFLRAQIEAGDAVGPVAAQSIGEPCTQLTLNTFHLSGVGGKSTVTRGVPRLQELFHLSKNPKNPSLTIKLIPSLINDKARVQRVSTEIGLIPLRNLVLGSEIRHETRPLYEDFSNFNNKFKYLDNSANNQSNWILTIWIDRSVLLDKHIEMEEIFYGITSIYENDIHCEYSDDNAEENFFRIRINPNSSELKKGINTEGILEISILSNIENKLMDNLVIRGVNSIQSATLRQDVGTGSTKEWLLDTIGSNIVDVVLHPDVDECRTTSNDIHEMYQVFGIEAARQTLINEIREVMDEASEIDPRHVHLLVDMMTTKGILIPIDRNGMKLTEVGAFAKCSFEEADQQLYKAAVFGETDNITGVSSNIILGQAPPCGTGTVSVSLDEERYFELLSQTNDEDYEDNTSEEDENDITFEIDD